MSAEYRHGLLNTTLFCDQQLVPKLSSYHWTGIIKQTTSSNQNKLRTNKQHKVSLSQLKAVGPRVVLYAILSGNSQNDNTT